MMIFGQPSQFITPMPPLLLTISKSPICCFLPAPLPPPKYRVPCSPNSVIVAGLLLCVLPFALLGPSPLLRPLLAAAGLLGQWLIWLSLVWPYSA